jgi:hypothetical protein
MSGTRIEVYLLPRDGSYPVRGILRDLQPAIDLANWRKTWKPLLENSDEDDRSWDWGAKFMNYHYASDEYYAIECEERTQGLMLLDTDFHRSKEGGRNLVYVHFLATAPWNRKMLMKTPRFSLVGPLLLRHALVRSEELGYQFRLGLHSLPGSEAWYERLRLKDYGPDETCGGLRYFEFTEEGGRAFAVGEEQK